MTAPTLKPMLKHWRYLKKKYAVELRNLTLEAQNNFLKIRDLEAQLQRDRRLIVEHQKFLSLQLQEPELQILFSDLPFSERERICAPIRKRSLILLERAKTIHLSTIEEIIS
jgi:hypothetical protein